VEVAGVCIALTVGCYWAAGGSSNSTTGSVSQLRAAWPCFVIRSCFVPCLLSKLNESRKCVTAVTVVTVIMATVTMVTAVNVGTVTVVTMATSVSVITVATVTMATVVTVVLWYCGGRAPP
jgi:hypothetical protein